MKKRMSPILYVAIFFLKINRRLWDTKSVVAAIKVRPEQRYINLDDNLFYG